MRRIVICDAAGPIRVFSVTATSPRETTFDEGSRHVRYPRVGAWLIALVAGATSIHGQVAPCVQPQTLNAPDVAWCALTQLPRFLASESRQIQPRFPDMLRSAYVSGEVVVEATIGIDGRVDMSSFR